MEDESSMGMSMSMSMYREKIVDDGGGVSKVVMGFGCAVGDVATADRQRCE